MNYKSLSDQHDQEQRAREEARKPNTSPPSRDQDVQFLQRIANPQEPAIVSVSRRYVDGPDGFPYVRLDLNSTPHGSNSAASVVLECMMLGRGIVVFSNGAPQPAHVFSYRDLVCFTAFGSLDVPAEFDPAAFPKTADAPVPAGTNVQEGMPNPRLLPQAAEATLNRLLTKACGTPTKVTPRIYMLPAIDQLVRFKLNIHPAPSNEKLNEVGRIVTWCLPFAVYANPPQPTRS